MSFSLYTFCWLCQYICWLCQHIYWLYWYSCWLCPHIWWLCKYIYWCSWYPQYTNFKFLYPKFFILHFMVNLILKCPFLIFVIIVQWFVRHLRLSSQYCFDLKILHPFFFFIASNLWFLCYIIFIFHLRIKIVFLNSSRTLFPIY
jgi:hypothetical protein